jgi:hypothetical protein
MKKKGAAMMATMAEVRVMVMAWVTAGVATKVKVGATENPCNSTGSAMAKTTATEKVMTDEIGTSTDEECDDTEGDGRGDGSGMASAGTGSGIGYGFGAYEADGDGEGYGDGDTHNS